MTVTKHAALRSQQRAIPPLLVDLLLQFGASEAAGAGVEKLYFDKAARRRVQAYAGPLASLLDQHLDVYAVVSTTHDSIITIGHLQQRIRRH